MSEQQSATVENEEAKPRCASATGTVYRFSTFQELVDKVPADKIRDCMTELGKILGTTKATAELTYMVAENLAAAEGKNLPPMPESIIKLPPHFEWIDDGKGELEARMESVDGVKLGTLKITPNVKVSDPAL